MAEHYTEGRRWSHISNAWILLASWNDREEIASLRARLSEAPSKLAAAIHYPDCWDQAAYPTLVSALNELAAAFRCTNDHCTHSVTEKPWPFTGTSGPLAITEEDETDAL